MRNIITGAVSVIVAVTISVVLVGGNTNQTLSGQTSDTWDAAGYLLSGTEFLDSSGNLTITGETNVSGLIRGGSSLATTTNGAGTFTAAQVCNNNLIVATPNVGAVTLTFPTTAQLVADCLPTIGDEKTIRLQNATTTTGAPSILTLAEGANGDHQESEGGTTLVEGTEWAEITFLNIDGTNHMMLVKVTQAAD